MSDALLKRVEEKRDEMIALLQDIVRIPTLNPPGQNYREICEYLAKRLERSGFSCEFIRAFGAPGDSDQFPRWNVVARREGPNPGECVHFSSHVDVVAVGEGWTRDPFGGELDDGKIYGRGSCDMKGGLAASIIAAEAFIETHPDYHGAIEISCTADEESGGYAGVAYLAEQGYFDPARVQHAIIPEPLGHRRICLGHRGGWWAEIETKGKIAHGCMPFLGDCAVRHMGAVLDLFEERLFPAMAKRHTEMPVIPEEAKASTLNINSIHGGQEEQTNGLPAHCVPDRCRIVIDRRFLIEEGIDAAQGEIIDLLEELKTTRPGFDYDLREINRVLPSMTAMDAPVVTTFHESIQEVLGHAPTYVASPGTYDQKHVDRIGKLKNCIAYGPGDLEMAHMPDEFVAVSDLMDSAKVMSRSLEKLLLPK